MICTLRIAFLSFCFVSTAQAAGVDVVFDDEQVDSERARFAKEATLEALRHRDIAIEQGAADHVVLACAKSGPVLTIAVKRYIGTKVVAHAERRAKTKEDEAIVGAAKELVDAVYPQPLAPPAPSSIPAARRPLVSYGPGAISTPSAFSVPTFNLQQVDLRERADRAQVAAGVLLGIGLPCLLAGSIMMIVGATGDRDAGYWGASIGLGVVSLALIPAGFAMQAKASELKQKIVQLSGVSIAPSATGVTAGAAFRF
jgi:hypothetical protein